MDVTLRNQVLALSQEKIYSIYFKIDIKDITWSTIDNWNKLSNPFREDSNPSLSFKWYNDKLIVRDWGDSRWNGDVFKVIGYILNMNCYVNTQFITICNDILIRYYNDANNNTPLNNEEYKVIAKVKTITKIDTKIRTLQKRDYNYFNAYGILNKTVDKYVEAVIRYDVNDIRTAYKNDARDPCYKYTVNHIFTKLYFPNRHKKSVLPRFVTNNILQIDDITDIQYSNDKILVKSVKDKMLVIQILETFNISRNDIDIHTASSETASFKLDILTLLRENTKYHIYAMFDADKTGIISMNELKTNADIIPLIFSSEAKDPTDFYKAFGYDKTIEVFKQIINQIHDNRNNFINHLNK